MERVYALTDEYGNFGWDLDNPDVSSVFIISAVLVKESNLECLRTKIEAVRKKHFQTGEMKSSGIGSNHSRRKRMIAELLPLPFAVFSVVIDKQPLIENRGLQYKKSFYKFMNNIVHKELRKAFKILTIVADEIGGSDYMQSFSKYIAEKQDIPNLWQEANFFFENSDNDVLLQLADLISGTLGHQYDPHKHIDGMPDYYYMLREKFIRIELYPKTYNSYILDNSVIADDYDKEIAELCFRQAATYIEKHESDDDPEESARVVTVKYLLFRFMNNDLRSYIPTIELKNQLLGMEIGKISTHFFRTRIIAKLRDAGVIIASSTAGYRIPSKEAELYDFINIGTTIIMPMLERLKKCRDLVKLGTINHLDLFDQSEYRSLQKFFDDKPISDILTTTDKDELVDGHN